MGKLEQSENQVFVSVFRIGKNSHELREVGLWDLLNLDTCPALEWASKLLISYIPFLIVDC